MKKTTVDSGAPRDAATVGRPWRRAVREGLLTFPSLGWLVVFFLIPTIIVALIAISLIAVFTYFSKATAKKVAGATEAISDQEGQNARNAADNINEDTIKKLGEN